MGSVADAPVPSGQSAWTTAGSYSWTVPADVTGICGLCVGAGGGGSGSNATDESSGGGGGALSYSNAISVTPGETLDIVVGAAGTAGAANGNGGTGGDSWIKRGATTLLLAKGGGGGTPTEGGSGGSAASGTGGTKNSGGGGRGTSDGSGGGGGGAAGYSGGGGTGNGDFAGSSGSGGGGGGGDKGDSTSGRGGGGGGGVGLLGSGSNGASGFAVDGQPLGSVPTYGTTQQGTPGQGTCGPVTITVQPKKDTKDTTKDTDVPEVTKDASTVFKNLKPELTCPSSIVLGKAATILWSCPEDPDNRDGKVVSVAATVRTDRTTPQDRERLNTKGSTLDSARDGLPEGSYKTYPEGDIEYGVVCKNARNVRSKVAKCAIEVDGRR
jgi:hypothetical protein